MERQLLRQSDNLRNANAAPDSSRYDAQYCTLAKRTASGPAVDGTVLFPLTGTRQAVAVALKKNKSAEWLSHLTQTAV